MIRKAHQTFKPGDKGLALLPVHGHRLQARYCGPFLIGKKVNNLNHVFKTPGHQKANRLCHGNTLKAYHEREPLAIAAIIVSQEKLESCAEVMNLVDRDLKLQNSDIF